MSLEEKETPKLADPEFAIADNKVNDPIRRLILFQFKLVADAVRDLLLSPVSFVCTLIDLVNKNHGKNSYFERLMALGRTTDQKINLFEQHDNDEQTVESVLKQVEELVLKEYKEKQVSKKTYSAIEKLINKSKP